MNEAFGELADGRYFATFAEATVRNGFSPIPLLAGQKRPLRAGLWHSACWTLPDIADIAELAAARPDLGVGLACGRHTVAFDIDVPNAEGAHAIRAIVTDVCGPTPLVRVGAAPKVALVYRSAEPIVSLRIPCFDILGLGGQLVAYGDHPVTGRSYVWTGEAAPHRMALRDVPAVTQEQCVAVASEVLRRVLGARFRKFDFAIDYDLVTMACSSRSLLATQLLTRLFLGSRKAAERIHGKVARHERPPGIWGFAMRPDVEGGFDHRAFARLMRSDEVADLLSGAGGRGAAP